MPMEMEKYREKNSPAPRSTSTSSIKIRTISFLRRNAMPCVKIEVGTVLVGEVMEEAHFVGPA